MTPSWRSNLKFKQRSQALLFYAGFIPFFPSLLFGKKRNKKVTIEYHRALAVSFFQTCTFLLALTIWIFGFYAVASFSPHSLETLRLGNIFILGYLILAILLAGFFIWFAYFISAFFGLKLRISLISKIAKNKRILGISYFINTALIILFCLLIFCTFRSNQMAQKIQKPAKVVMLYDDMGFVPHWIFPLGFYPIQRTAAQKWGEGHVSIEPISNESLKEAIQNATLVFLSVHGDYSFGEFAGLFHFADETREKFYSYGPKQIEEIGVGENLKFVYLAQCNGGALADEWRRVFAPAKVKTFDRISLYPEHIYWLWYKIPKILRERV